MGKIISTSGGFAPEEETPKTEEVIEISDQRQNDCPYAGKREAMARIVDYNERLCLHRLESAKWEQVITWLQVIFFTLSIILIVRNLLKS